MLLRREAIALVLEQLTERDAVVLANGYIAREGGACRDRESNFYMIGSMGLAASIGLGVALGSPGARVIVLDGDGNLLMGLGVLPMVGAWQPRHFVHVVLDNGTYGSTGSQPTLAASTDFAGIARASGYVEATSVASASALAQALARVREREGPVLIHVRVSAAEGAAAPRVPHEPEVIARRFAAALRRIETAGE